MKSWTLYMEDTVDITLQVYIKALSHNALLKAVSHKCISMIEPPNKLKGQKLALGT
jgi:hypothetical protein